LFFFINNPAVGQFIDAKKTSIINSLAYRGLCATNCKDDGATLLDNLQLLLRAPDSALQNPTINHDKETSDVPQSFHVAQQVQKGIGTAVYGGNMEVFSVTYVSDSIAR
jgi:hypothetical protein